MKKLSCFFGLLVLAVSLYGQSDRGTITGTVSDAAGALIPSAAVIAINPENGAQFRTETTSTGNYTSPSVPEAAMN